MSLCIQSQRYFDEWTMALWFQTLNSNQSWSTSFLLYRVCPVLCASLVSRFYSIKQEREWTGFCYDSSRHTQITTYSLDSFPSGWGVCQGCTERGVRRRRSTKTTLKCIWNNRSLSLTVLESNKKTIPSTHIAPPFSHSPMVPFLLGSPNNITIVR